MRARTLFIIYICVLHVCLVSLVIESPHLISTSLILKRELSSLGWFERSDSENYRSHVYKGQGQEDVIAWQQALRAELVKILKLERPGDSEFNITVINKEVRQIISDESGEEGLNAYVFSEMEMDMADGRRQRIFMTEPVGIEGKLPVVILLSGHDHPLQAPFENGLGYHEVGKELAKRGFITFTTEINRHHLYNKSNTLMGERLQDLIRCLDYLVAQEQVDKNNIACLGLSLGGEMAMYLGAIDTRISAVVSCGFLTVMDHLENTLCMCWKFDGLRELVDLADIYSLIAPRPLQCQIGRREDLVLGFPEHLARVAWRDVLKVYRDADAGDEAQLLIHDLGHEVEVEAAIQFLEHAVQ